MKSNTLRKSGLCLLVVAGAMVPIASSAEEGSKYGNQATGTAMERGDQGAIRTESMNTASPSYRASELYPDLQSLYSSKSWAAIERGAQGPIRTDSMDSASPLYSATELYPDLQALHSSRSWNRSERGAQGPIRTDSMDSASPSHDAGDLYPELKSIQR